MIASGIQDGPMQDARVTGALTDFLVSSRWEDVPDDVRHAARRSILNFFGTALGGSRDAAIAGTLAVLDRFSGRAPRQRDRPARQARHAERRIRQRGERERARLRRHASPDHHPSDRAGRAGAVRARRVAADLRRGAAARLRARRRGRMPARQCGHALALPARLAHHVDLRRVRRRRGGREAAGLRCRAFRLGARQRVGAILRPGRDARHDGEEHRCRRARRAADLRPRCSRRPASPARPSRSPGRAASPP